MYNSKGGGIMNRIKVLKWWLCSETLSVHELNVIKSKLHEKIEAYFALMPYTEEEQAELYNPMLEAELGAICEVYGKPTLWRTQSLVKSNKTEEIAMFADRGGRM